MATGYKTQHRMMHYISKKITYADAGTTVTVGLLPPGSRVVDGGVVVETAFNGDTTNTVDIGVTGDSDGFATALALGTVGIIAADALATSDEAHNSGSTDVTAVADVVSTASPTAGAGTVWLQYFFPEEEDV